MSVTKEQLISDIERFVEKIRFTNACVSIWQDLNRKHNSPMWRKELSIAPVFFTVTRMSLHRTLFIETAKLFDKNNDSMSIYKLLERCEQSKLFTYSSINSFKEHLNTISDAIYNLKKHRDKFIAHPDKDYFHNPNDLAIEYPIRVDGKVFNTFEQFKNNQPEIDYGTDIIDLLGSVFMICENILNALTGEEKNHKTRYDGVDDIHELFMCLSKCAWEKEECV